MTTFGKTGVLIVNLGTPDKPSYGSVFKYLNQFLTDGRVIDIPWIPRQMLVRGIITPFRSNSSAKLYKMLWTENGSPLKYYGERVREEVQKNLGDEYIVELAMRYQNPSIESAIDKLLNQQVSNIIVFPMFPQYASASTGSAHEEVMRVLSKYGTIPNVQMINSYYDYEPLIEIFSDNARQFDLDSYDHVIFSFHGLPKRQLIKADTCNHCQKVENCCETISIKNQFCYGSQCNATAQAIAANLGLKKEDYTIAYQSRLGGGWIEPFSDKVIEELAEGGAKRLLMFSPAFTADCLETIVEIGTEYQEEFEEMGGEHIDLVPSLNDNPKWVQAIADLIRMNDVKALAKQHA
jgi:ferrochelatase